MTYRELIDSPATESEIRAYLADCDQVAIAFRIPQNL